MPLAQTHSLDQDQDENQNQNQNQNQSSSHPLPRRRESKAKSSSSLSFLNTILIFSITTLLLTCHPNHQVLCQSSSSSSGTTSDDMSLPLTLSKPRACTPLNITFPVYDDAFPYTVWIIGNYSAVPTWRVESDYPRSGINNESVTFQYSVPNPNGQVDSFSVGVGDSRGRANTTGVLSMTTSHGAPSNCNPWTENNNFYWSVEKVPETSSDDSPGDFEECQEVEFASADQRGMAPFTLTYLPLGSRPKSINLIPNVTRGLDQMNATDFRFRTFIPFPAGTLLEMVMGDSNYFGGGGGASKVYTIAPNRNSSNSNCASELEREEIFNNNTALIIPAFPIATFNDLPGAISEYPKEKKNNAAIIGGVIGATVAVGLVVAALVLYFLYRKREKRKREELMWKEPKFIEVDEREGGRGWRRGVNQTYSVSPFVPTSDPGSMSSASGSGSGSTQGAMPQTHASGDSWRSGNGSYNGIPHHRQPSSSDSPPISPSSRNAPTTAGGYSTVPTSSSFNWPINPTSVPLARDLQTGTSSAGSYLSATGSRSMPIRGDASLMDPDVQSSSIGAGGTLMTQTDSQGGTRRVLVHSDAGFLQGDELEDEEEDDVDELPPSYDRDWGTTSSVANSDTNNLSISPPTPHSNSINTNSAMNPSPLRQEAFSGLAHPQSEPSESQQVENQRESEIRDRIERERLEQDADNQDMWLSR